MKPKRKRLITAISWIYMLPLVVCQDVVRSGISHDTIPSLTECYLVSDVLCACLRRVPIKRFLLTEIGSQTPKLHSFGNIESVRQHLVDDRKRLVGVGPVWNRCENGARCPPWVSLIKPLWVVLLHTIRCLLSHSNDIWGSTNTRERIRHNGSGCPRQFVLIPCAYQWFVLWWTTRLRRILHGSCRHIAMPSGDF